MNRKSSIPFNERFVAWKNETTHKAKRVFFEKNLLAASSLLKQEKDTILNRISNDSFLEDIEEETTANNGTITPQSDLSRAGRHIFVVTTAAIPWFTGTAYLCRLTREINHKAAASRVTSGNESNTEIENRKLGEESFRMVTLVIPWLELEEDRIELYGNKYNFTTPEDQEVYIRDWLSNQAKMPFEADKNTGLKIIFYPARYHFGLKSIFAIGDITALTNNGMHSEELSPDIIMLQKIVVQRDD